MNSNLDTMKKRKLFTPYLISLVRKTICFLANLHILCSFSLTKTACSNPDQFQPISTQDEAKPTTNVTVKENLFNIESFTAEQQNFIYLLGYPIINDIQSHASSKKISKKFTNTFFYLQRGPICKCPNSKHSTPPKLELNDDIKNELELYFNSNDSVLLESHIKKKLNSVIDEIKKINSYLDIINCIVLCVKNCNTENYKKVKTSFKLCYDLGLEYIKKLEAIFTKKLIYFMKKIEIAKGKNCDNYDYFIIDAREIFLEYHNILLNIILEYEKQISTLKFDKCIQKMKPVSNYWYLNDIQTFFEKIFYGPLKVSIFSTPEEIKNIAKKLNSKCGIYSDYNVQEDDNSTRVENYNEYKNALISSFDSLIKNIGILENSLDVSTKNNIFYSILTYFYDFIPSSQNTTESFENISNEYIEFDNKLITLFKLNMKGLIYLKIFVNAIEYFEIYHYSYLHIKKSKPFHTIKKENILEDDKIILGIKNRLKTDVNLEDLKNEELVTLYCYFLYQDHKKTCFDSNTTFFRYLNEMCKFFGEIENKVLRLCCDFLSNDDNKEIIYDAFLNAYEEEYLRLAKEVEKDLLYPFERLPKKLKKMIN